MDVSKVFDCTHVEERDLVSRYLARKLSPEEAEAFEEHYFGCDRCWAEVQHATELRAALEEKGAGVAKTARVIRGPWRTWAPLAAAAGIALAVAAIFLVPRNLSRSGEPATLVADLAKAVGSGHSVRARFTGGFEFPATSRSAATTSAPAWRVFAEAEKIKVAAGERPSPEMVRTLALAHLFTGDVDAAVTRLKEATLRAPQDPLSHSDLAAAYLTLSKRKNRPDLVPLALSEADSALQLRPKLPEAHFNRALALEELSLRDQAESEWREYLRLDPDSAWSAEARRHLRSEGALSLPRWAPAERILEHWAESGAKPEELPKLTDQFAQQVRESVEQELLPSWADGLSHVSRSVSARRLSNLRVIADAHCLRTGDRLLCDTLAAAERIFRSGDQVRLAHLAEGLRQFRLGRSLIDRVKAREALSHFEAASEELRAAANPLHGWADFYGAMCLYYGDSLQDSAAACDRLEPFARKNSYGALLGRTLWMEGLIHLLAGKVSLAVANYTDALGCFERNREPGHVAAVHSLLAGALSYLGEPTQSWGHRLAALRALGSLDDARRVHRIYSDAAVDAVSAGLPAVSLAFQDAAMATAGVWDSSVVSTEAHLYRSFLLRRLDRFEEASIELGRARRRLVTIEDPALRRAENAELALAVGETEATARPLEARRRLTDALRYFEETNQPMRLSEVYLYRGRASMNAGDFTAAARDLDAGVAELERQRSLQGRFGVSFFEKAWDFFDEIVEIEALHQNKPLDALAYAERLRARDLLTRQSSSASPGHQSGSRTDPFDLQRIRTELPTSAALLYFAVLKDSVLSWLMTTRSVDFQQTVVPAGELTRLVSLYRLALENGHSSHDINRLGAKLYDILIRPQAAGLRPGMELVIVPDGAIHEVPFASLVDRKSGRFLIQDNSLVFSPSGTAFLLASRRLASLASLRVSSVAVFGDPQADPRIASDLPSLPFAAEEARAIAHLYPQATLLLGKEATRSRFLEAAGRGGILHFAGHAVVNAEYPDLSRLVLAPETNGQSGDLLVGDLYGRSFGVTLVILAACRSVEGVTLRGEGSMNLARPFLAGGVPSVLGALWDIDDRAGSQLFEGLHGGLIAGRSPAQALREAQLRCLASDDIQTRSPRTWGTLALFGAG